MRKVLIFAAIFVLSATLSHAACTGGSPTWTTTADYASVSTCVSNAIPGDTININSGTSTWSSILYINKPIKLIGAGIGSTVITGNIQLNTTSGSGPYRISGFTFNFDGNGIKVNNRDIGSDNWRIDSIRFNYLGSANGDAAILVEGWTFGLVDSCVFSGVPRGVFIGIGLNSSDDPTWWGDYSWTQTLYLGNSASGNPKAVYIENNTFQDMKNRTDQAVEGRWGARYVFRNNTVYDYEVDTHSGCTNQGRNVVSAEIYDNTLTALAGGNNTALLLRSVGTVIAFNNTISGANYTNGMLYDQEQSCQNVIVCSGKYSSECSTYPCDDNIGRKPPSQAISPWYEWDNTKSGSTTYLTENVTCGNMSTVVQENRDFYHVSSGTSVPGSCSGSSGYYHTGEKKLYVCSSGTYAAYYEPLVYPHPFRGGQVEDTTAPYITNRTQADYSCSSDPRDVTMTVDTNEAANCRYSTSNIAYNSMTLAFTTTGGTTHTQTLSKACGSSSTYYVRCEDRSTNKNQNSSSTTVSFSVAAAGGDTTPPTMSNPLPTGILLCDANPKTVTLQVTATDETATITCKYDTSDGAYAGMAGTFDTEGGTLTANVDASYPESNWVAGNYTTNDTYMPVHAEQIGQSFNSAGGTLNTVQLWMSKIGSPTGNAVVKVYSDAGTYGTDSTPDTLLATSGNVDVTSIQTHSSYSLITFTFSGAERITLVAGTKYVLTLSYSGGDASNYIIIGGDIVSPSYGGNSCYYNGSAWVADANEDRIFYVNTMIGSSGSGTFSKDISLACGASYTYYSRCTDGTTASSSSQTHSFSIASAVPISPGAIEAESGTEVSPMMAVADVLASGGYYVATTTENQGTATISVTAPSAGVYRVIVRTYSPDSGSDSMFLKIGTQDQVVVGFNPAQTAGNYNVWREHILQYITSGNTWAEYQVTLTTDATNWVWTGREAGARLDYFYLQKVIEPQPQTTGTTYRILGTGNTVVIGSGNTIIIE